MLFDQFIFYLIDYGSVMISICSYIIFDLEIVLVLKNENEIEIGQDLFVERNNDVIIRFVVLFSVLKIN